jgi:hypothetical protein
MKWAITVFGISVSFLAAGCGGSGNSVAPSSAASTPAAVAGQYSGSALSDFGGFTYFTLNIVQQGSNITGTYSCQNGSLRCLHSTGSLSGTVSGSTLTGRIDFGADGSSCSAFRGTFAANSWTGQYTCGGPVVDNGTWTASTAPSASSCAQTTVLEGSGSVPAYTADVESITTTTTGRLDVTLDWTSSSSTMLIAVAQEPCSFDQWKAGSCRVLLNSSSPPKPLKASVQGLAAGSYVLFIGNANAVAESVSVQVLSSTGSCPAVSSLTTQATDLGLPNEIHGGRSGLLRP